MSVEAYLCGRPERALEARRALLELHEAAGDSLRVGDDLRWLSRILWWSGKGAEAAAAGDRAIAVLETLPEGRELAMALSGRSQLAMSSEGNDEAITLGTRAIRLARRIDDRETVAHALTNVGTTLLGGPEHERGRALLEEAFTLAVDAGHDDHAARALVNLATTTLVRRRDDPRVVADLNRALAFARERNLDGYVQYALGARANLRLAIGAWPAAEADARASLDLGEQPGVSLCPALIALGRLQVRRGDREAGDTLDEAWRRAVHTQELQRLAPVAAARAENAWLDGDVAGTAAAARAAYPLVAKRGSVWARGELALLAVARGRARRSPGQRGGAVRALDRRRLERRAGGVVGAPLPLRRRRRALRRPRRRGAARRARGVRRLRRRARRPAPAPAPARRRRAADPARSAAGVACRRRRA